MTDKATVKLLEELAKSVSNLQIDNAKNGLKINAVIWIMAAILGAILPAFGFLIAYWVQHGK